MFKNKKWDFKIFIYENPKSIKYFLISIIGIRMSINFDFDFLTCVIRTHFNKQILYFWIKEEIHQGKGKMNKKC